MNNIVVEGEVVETANGKAEPKLVPKANGRITELERRVGALEGDTRLDSLVWLHAEMVHNMKLAAAQQILSNPEVQARLQQAVMAQLNGQIA